jgi:hypothetical protein
MRSPLCLGFLLLPSLLVLGLPARADEIQLGTGPVCDVQQQVEPFVALYGGDAEAATGIVNTEAHNPRACAVLTFQILEALMVGVITSEGVRAVEVALLFGPGSRGNATDNGIARRKAPARGVLDLTPVGGRIERPWALRG